MKKIALLITITFIFNLSSFAQWNDNGTNLTTTDNVGIGITYPSEKLDIDGAIRVRNGSDSWRFVTNSSGSFSIKETGFSGALNIYKSGSVNTNLLNLLNGNVGIGTVSPKAKLDIEGGDFYLGEEVSKNGERRQIRVYGYDNSSQFYGSIHSNWEDAKRTFDIYTSSLTNQLKIDASANSSGRIVILPGENTGVGIGTINPGSWKLAVNGKIRAKEIKVETSWSDFVFYNDYKLPTLQEVENHIKEKGHLKDIPSAEEVGENGIFLGEMDSKLLQKIEELTLYTIQQEKEIQKLKTQNTRIDKQEKEIFKLKLLVKKLLKSKK
ncbi:hypothetical protein [Flavivirga eckloniae]|uniref:Peptidase S74 domain-containing protein n=1 Tax=Flavivirga eckloniae TaxID=1803846 RepID=A0A2K9PK58_9FLAO|nr:hypothetical protein [Flavivirga eckloniae]AUP77422.1 hypothetical protein C1H87_01275 [Flavivirga eckloniae]